MTVPFDNSFAALPGRFHARQMPTAVTSPKLVKLNTGLAAKIGVDVRDLTVDVLAGNSVPDGADPVAMAYAGHQFGGFVPQLGDGRAVLLGEVVGPDGVRRDIQLKGSGPTVFSRNGDGRAAIGAVLREYIVSEAMAALGIPTTRALAAVTTGDMIRRETLLPGGVLTRVAQSHIRVGTFQYHFAQRDTKSLARLAEYAIDRHYPEAARGENPVLAFFESVVERQAGLIAKWMQVGFIHGVMNTDNMSIAGETIDFGPCAFMDKFHPDTVFSSIDRHGRYAWSNQPNIAHWNLAQLGQSLMVLVDKDADVARSKVSAVLDRFPALFSDAYYKGFAAKAGVAPTLEGRNLIRDLHRIMAENAVDFSLFFHHLTEMAQGGSENGIRHLFDSPDVFDAWALRWQDLRTSDPASEMRRVNPVFIPRNHRVEEVIVAANAGIYEPLDRLLGILENPFEPQPENEEYMAEPRPEEIVYETFCGT